MQTATVPAPRASPSDHARAWPEPDASGTAPAVQPSADRSGKVGRRILRAMSVDTTPHHDAAKLLQAEHAVARVLVETCDEATAYPRLLRAIGESLGWEVGALWRPSDVEPGALHCAETWQGREPFEQRQLGNVAGVGRGTAGPRLGEREGRVDRGRARRRELPARVQRSPRGAAHGVLLPDPRLGRGARRHGVPRLRGARARRTTLLETMTSLGSRIGQCVERWRAEGRLRESDARKTAMLDAAFDCIITMDAEGRVVEVNRATERTFGYAAAEMVGRELAELIIPPALREPHRRGVAQYVATGEAKLLGHPVELPAMRADGSEFPSRSRSPGRTIEGPPQFTGYIRDVTHRKRDERALRTLAEEQAALRRVATTVASGADQEWLFALVTEEVGHLLGANSSNTLRFEPDGTGLVVGAWSTGGVAAVPVGTHVALDGPTIGTQILRSGRPALVDSYEGMEGTTAAMLRELGFRSGVGAPDQALRAALGRSGDLECRGAGVPGRLRAAHRRLRRAHRAGARQRRGARGGRRVACPDRRGGRCRTATHRAKPARRRAAAAGLAVGRHAAGGEQARRATPKRESSWREPTQSSPTPCRSCASWLAASTRRSSPIAGSGRR